MLSESESLEVCLSPVPKFEGLICTERKSMVDEKELGEWDDHVFKIAAEVITLHAY